MKHALLIMVLFLSGCGSLYFGQDRVVYKYGKLSCIGLRCCYPYGPKENFTICNQGHADGDGMFIRYRFGK